MKQNHLPKNTRQTILIFIQLLVVVSGMTGTAWSATEHVIHISVDGLRSDAVTALGSTLAPNFHRLRTEGAFTDNARTDPKVTNTLPNHASQITGLGVLGESGHEWYINDDFSSDFTIHLFKALQNLFRGRFSFPYISSVFDVVHDRGLSTALYANKGKFAVFDRSWDRRNGARDRVGSNNGRDKIDTYFHSNDMATVTRAFVEDMASSNYHYTLLHFRQPDSTGHDFNWDLTPDSEYLNAVRDVDAMLGDILSLVETNPGLQGTTSIILTSDHGGELGTNLHFFLEEVGLVESAIVPFYVWGPDVEQGENLYDLNQSQRTDPGSSMPTFADQFQPIRNGDAGNLALKLLGLPAIPGSTINAAQDLVLRY